MDKNRLEELRTMFDTLVDGLDCDLFNSIRFKISEANETLDALIDAELARQVPDEEIQRAIDLLGEKKALVYGALDNQQTPECDRQYLWKNIWSYDLAIAALRQYRKPEPWIPVSERLPEHYGHTLVRQKISVGEITEMAYYSNGGWMNCGKKIGVTYWMPLPEPPLGGDRA